MRVLVYQDFGCTQQFLNSGLRTAFFAANLIAYPWLVFITICGSSGSGKPCGQTLFNPRLVFSFFTIVAGTDVFGVGLHLRGFTTAALFLWLFALLVWFILIYFSFAVLTFLNTAHGANVVHGGWLIAIVGTESLVILGTLIAPTNGRWSVGSFPPKAHALHRTACRSLSNLRTSIAPLLDCSDQAPPVPDLPPGL
jgi:hypothetical protein